MTRRAAPLSTRTGEPANGGGLPGGGMSLEEAEAILSSPACYSEDTRRMAARIVDKRDAANGGWIVDLEPGVWSRRCDGDPGRTLRRDSATPYESKDAVRGALDAAREYRPFCNARILPAGAVLHGRLCSCDECMRTRGGWDVFDPPMDAETAADRAAAHQPGSPDEPWAELGDVIPAHPNRGNPPWES